MGCACVFRRVGKFSSVQCSVGFGIWMLGLWVLHWGGVESEFRELGYSFLPYVYLLFVLFGLGAFVFRALPGG